MPADPAASARILRLLADARADRRALDRRTGDIRAFSPGPATPERIAALALSLDRAYTALETLIDRVARVLEGGVPAGEDWHRALLRGAGLAIDRLRPAILGPRVLAAADELRRFRHLLRHAYAAELDASRLAGVAAQWLSAAADLAADLDSFERFLSELADRL